MTGLASDCVVPTTHLGAPAWRVRCGGKDLPGLFGSDIEARLNLDDLIALREGRRIPERKPDNRVGKFIASFDEETARAAHS